MRSRLLLPLTFSVSLRQLFARKIARLVSFCHCKKKEEGRRKREETLVSRLCLGTHIGEALPRIVHLGNKGRKPFGFAPGKKREEITEKGEEGRTTRFQALPGNAYRRGSASNCPLRK